jgi:hypothetical protein
MKKYVLFLSLISIFATHFAMEELIFEPGLDAVVIAVGQKNIEVLKKFFGKDAQGKALLDVNMPLEGGTNTPLGIALEDYAMALNEPNFEKQDKSTALINYLLKEGAKPDLLKQDQIQTYNYYRKLPLSLREIVLKKASEQAYRNSMIVKDVENI